MENRDKLYKKILSESNIYSAIYAIDSYIYEKGLLSKDDIILYNKLIDKYNFDTITPFIKECQDLLCFIFKDINNLFDVQVYFKWKKVDDNGSIKYRPIHSAELKVQVCMVAMLNVIMFEDIYAEQKREEEDSRRLSSLSNLIPSNFYGNLPSHKVESIFQPWKVKYQEYSDAIIEKYSKYSENKLYTHEVSLDFKEFFPSIDPQYIYNYIIDKSSANYTEDELETLKIAVSKLLYCNLTNADSCELINEYYGETYIEGKYYTKGIQQGLPQGYYFGNICMIELSKCIAKVFDGDALYYVDDSVIYTNKSDKFDLRIRLLNISINRIAKDLFGINQPMIHKDVAKFHAELNYEIRLHLDGKSTISELGNAHWGLSQLRLLAGETYNINSALFLSIDETEDKTTKNKLDKITEVIDKELDFVGIKKLEGFAELERINALESYEKLLIRYRKFCKFRLEIITTRLYDNEDNAITSTKFKYKYLTLHEDNTKLIEGRNEFFQIYDKDIFEAELGLLINSGDCNSQKTVLKDIIKFEEKFTSIKNCSYLYYSRHVIGQIRMARKSLQRDNSLDMWVRCNYKGYHKFDSKQTIKSLQKAISQECIKLPLLSGVNYSKFIYNTSDEFRRKILNAILSQIINVDYSDSPVIQKRDNRPLRYYELRLLIWLRNKGYNSKEYFSFATKVLEEAEIERNIENIDYQIIEILHILMAKVKKPQKVDDIILVHKLVNGLWKNGSKFLHFYTLHNEEHSIALIKNIIRIVNTVSYLNIKELDYYVLFLACYLHDISMVIHPDLNNLCIDSTNSDLIYNKFIKNMSSMREFIYDEPKSNVKHLVLDYFKKVDNYFESTIRDNHTKDSAAFIKNRSGSPYLKFIDSAILQVVADISESHGYDSTEVYGRKSRAKSEIYSMKYMMILIRFADLLDLAKDRVSDYILKENIAHMSKTSQFHWISHYVTDKCELKADFKIIPPTKTDYWLRCGVISESIGFDLYLNTKQLTSTSKSNCRCKKYASCSQNQEDNVLSIRVGKDDRECDAKDCSLLCKWMTTKHEYLFSEIHELVKYLDTVNHGLFITEITVNLYYGNKRILEPKLLDSVIEYLNN